jgi:MFS family permease
MMCGGLVIHGLAYLELPVEEYICNNGDVCDQEVFCAQPDPNFSKSSIDYEEASTNIYNWYTKLGLVCKKRFATALIAIIALFSMTLSCLFIPRLGDLYGRKPIYLTAIIMQIPVYAICAWSKSLTVVYVGAFALGPTIIGRMSCGFFLLMEQVPQRH